MHKDLDRAMGLAGEYYRVARDEGSNHARARQLANEIDALVGRWENGKLVLPEPVRRAMRGEVGT